MPTLYFNDMGSGLWSDPLNWFTDSEGTSPAALVDPIGVPWLRATPAFLNYDLILGTSLSASGNSPNIDQDIQGDPIAGGTCNFDLVNLTVVATIWDGIYTGGSWALYGTIVGGNFTPTFSWTADGATIHGGTFFGGYTLTLDESSYVDGGVFDVQVVLDDASIAGGTFNGAVYLYVNNSSIQEGTFFGPVFNNGGLVGGGFFYNEFYNSDMYFWEGGAALPTGGNFYGLFSSDLLNLYNQCSFYGIVSIQSFPLYTPTAPGVAPANKVLRGTTNLGVAGTASAGGGGSLSL